jgi:hypothetical protein
MPSWAKCIWIWAAVLSVSFPTRVAYADEWRYCLASSHAQRTIHMSQAFPTTESMTKLEAEFGRDLDRANLQYDSVQCPRGDQQSIANMRRQAIRLNRDTGNTVAEFVWSCAGC